MRERLPVRDTPLMFPAPRTEFSHRTRAYNLARMRAELFDILIIGGGITGAGIAREATLRGYKVALVEKNDFASGTSSQSSKLIHGGIRYLETFQFPLVFEASQERRRLLQLAPNHVWALPFLYPIYRDNRYGPGLINLGLWLYDGLALFRNVDRHQMLSTEQIAKELPALDVSNIVGGAHYYDAQTDDARLTLETIRSAHMRGAVIANHCAVEELTRSTGKRVDGVLARDLIGDEVINVRARVVVNATGPWTDTVLAMDSVRNPPRLRPTKGIHLLVPREKFATPEAVSFTVKSDGRLMFVLPRGEFTMIGTTDTHYEGDPDRVRAERKDVDYVLRAARASFPGARLGARDVISTYAGLRPLVASEHSLAPSAISREHEIWVTPTGLVNIAGGKLTTYRSMAQELVARVEKMLAKQFGIRATYRSRSARLPLVDGDGSGAFNRAQVEVAKLLPTETRQYLNRAYGARQNRVLDYIVADAKLRAPLVEGQPYLWAEIPHAVEQEMAMTLSDVMIRRLHLFHQVRDGAVTLAREIAYSMSRFLDWLDSDIEEEITAYTRAVEINRESLKTEEEG